jgi:hypothetical protein
MREREASERILEAGALVAAVGGILLVLATLANQFVLSPDVTSIDGRVEHSVWTWASSAATFAGAFVATVWLVVSPRRRLNVIAIVVTLAYFSLDDMLALHEEVGSDVGETLALPDWVGGLWLLAYPPLLVLAVWALVGATWNETAKIRRAMLAGIALLGAGLLLELVGIATKRLQLDGTAWPHAVRGAFEEAAELSGWIVVASALTAALVLELARVFDGPGASPR